MWGGPALGWPGRLVGQPFSSDQGFLLGQIVKKSCYPRWNETFEFELEERGCGALCVEAWDWDLVSRNDFLGKWCPAPSRPPLLASGPAVPSHSRALRKAWIPRVLRDPQQVPPLQRTVVGKEEKQGSQHWSGVPTSPYQLGLTCPAPRWWSACRAVGSPAEGWFDTL